LDQSILSNKKHLMKYGGVLIWLVFAAFSVFGETRSATSPVPPSFIVPKLVPAQPLPPRDVVSLKELIEMRSALAPRLIQDHFGFPLMPGPDADVIQDMLSEPLCASFGHNFNIRITRIGCLYESREVFDLLKATLSGQSVDLSENQDVIEMELCTFLVNYEALRSVVQQSSSKSGRDYLLQRLEELYQAGRTLLRFKEASLNGLKRLSEIDGENSITEPEGKAPVSFEHLAAESKGMRDEDIRAVLDLMDPREFSELSLERTAEVLGKKMTVEKAREKLSRMSPCEAIAAAAHFARSRMQAYANSNQQMNDLSFSEDDEYSWLQVGDCKKFAGLTVHYLNHVIKPLNPKLKHWYFGIQSSHIQDYHHAYCKAVNVHSKSESLDLFFFDPTVLASHPYRRLTPKRVQRLIEATSEDDHFFSLKRYAEDLVRYPLDPDAIFGREDFPVNSPDGQLNLNSILNN
jgi:hypothetical protein